MGAGKAQEIQRPHPPSPFLNTPTCSRAKLPKSHTRHLDTFSLKPTCGKTSFLLSFASLLVETGLLVLRLRGRFCPGVVPRKSDVGGRSKQRLTTGAPDEQHRTLPRAFPLQVPSCPVTPSKSEFWPGAPANDGHPSFCNCATRAVPGIPK